MSASKTGLVFAGGVPRSGLTLLRRFLALHPSLSVGPDTNIVPAIAMQWRNFSTSLGSLHETHFDLPPSTVAETFNSLLSDLLVTEAVDQHADWMIEKSPLNICVFRELASLFPEARFIHMVRDGRDVVRSLLERDWRDPQTGMAFPHVENIDDAASYWNGIVTMGLEAENDPILHGRILRVGFEDLVHRPKRTLTQLLRFLDLQWSDKIWSDPSGLHFVGIEIDSAQRTLSDLDPSRVGRWKRDLSTDAIVEIVNIASKNLRHLGYK